MCDLPDIPAALLANWRQWFGDADAIAEDVRARAVAALSAWGLSAPRLLSGGEVALVLAVARAEGAAAGAGGAVLKLWPRPGDAPLREGAALSLWAARGIAPRVWGVRDDGHTLLMERLAPGGSLQDAGAGASEILETIGGLCRRIHVPVADGAFAHLAAYAAQEGWAERLGGGRERGELARLLEPGAGDRLLHTDLHWLNVLRAGDRWAVIDPKPHVGDPHAETFAFFAGPPVRGIPAARPAGRAHVRRLAAGYAAAAGLDPDRLLVWIRLRALAIVAEPEVAGTLWGQRMSRLVDALG